MEETYDNDPVEIYLREVGSVAPLTMEEETALIQHVLAADSESDSWRCRLIETNLASSAINNRAQVGNLPHIPN